MASSKISDNFSLFLKIISLAAIFAPTFSKKVEKENICDQNVLKNNLKLKDPSTSVGMIKG